MLHSEERWKELRAFSISLDTNKQKILPNVKNTQNSIIAEDTDICLFVMFDYYNQ